MRKYLVLLVVIGFACIAMSFKGSYNKLWKKYEVTVEESLPRTGMDILSSIMQKAEKEREIGHYFKAYFISSQLKTSLGELSSKEVISRLEHWLATEQAEERQAILSTLLMNSYYQYYTSNLYAITSRTEVVGNDSIQQNLDLWTKNQYREKFSTLYHNIFDKGSLLRTKSAKDFQPFIEINTFGRYFEHDLYHVLLWYSLPYMNHISISLDLPNLASQKLLADSFSLYEGKPGAQFLLKLEQWRLKDDTKQNHLAALEELIAENKENELVVEAIGEKVDLLLSGETKNYIAAVELCTAYINKFSSYERIEILKNKLLQIKEPYLQLSVASRIHTNEALIQAVNYRNIHDYQLSIYKIDGLIELPQQREFTDEYLKSYGKLVETFQKDGLYQSDYQPQKDSDLNLKVQEPGYYIIKAKSKETQKPCYGAVLVSDIDLVLLQPSNSKHLIEILSLDGLSGFPAPDVVVNFYDSDNQKLGEVVTDSKGRASWLAPTQAYWTARAFYRGVLIEEYTRISTAQGSKHTTDIDTQMMSIITDRNIYRPGQKMFVKAYVYQNKKGELQVLENYKDTLVLYDTFHNEILKREVQTNEYGTFSLELQLPEQILPGHFSWSNKSRIAQSSTPIQVEEYKRPTYTIEFAPIEGKYKLGDTLVIKGKVESFSGSLLNGVKVKAEIVENRYQIQPYPLRLSVLPLQDERVLSQNELELTQTGDFAFKLQTHKESLGQLEVKITVSSLSGETYSATKAIYIDKEPYQIQLNESYKVVEKSEPLELLVFAKNSDGEVVSAQGVAEISRKIRGKEDKEQYERVKSFDFEANTAMKLNVSDLEIGEYRIEYKGEDLTDAASTYAYFIVYSATDKTVPVNSGSWLYLIQDSFDEFSPAEFLYGSADKDAYVYLSFYSDKGKVLAQEKVFHHNYQRYVIPYRKEFQEGVRVEIIYLKKHQVIRESFNLKRKEKSSHLQMKWITFRDKIRPGSQQKWILQLSNQQNKPIDAEVLAWMYDASLDELTAYRPNLSFSKLNISRTPWIYTWAPSVFMNSLHAYFVGTNYEVVQPLVFDTFDNYFSSVNCERPYVLYSKGPVMANSQVEGLMQEESSKFINNKVGSSSKDLVSQKTLVRTKFDELAFFYPRLRTNPKGEVNIEFSSPEQLSKWKFRALAHQKDMSTVSLEDVIYTEQKFAIQANIPRYIREGDQVKLASTLKNDEDKDLASTVSLVLFDPYTDKAIFKADKQLVVAAHSEQKITFSLPVITNKEAVGLKIMATTTAYGDGEQYILPVLSNTEPLVDSKSIVLVNDGKSVVPLGDLFNKQSPTASNKELTIELAANPIWFTASPIVAVWNREEENALTYTNKLMASVVAKQLITLYPGVFAQAASHGVSFKQLSTHEKLTNRVLAETPWLKQANDETALLAKLQQEATQYLSPASIQALVQKLLEYQNKDGSWSWHKGMQSYNDLLTLEVAETLQTLLQSTFLSPLSSARVEQALQKSVLYLYTYYGGQDPKSYGTSQSEWRTILLSQKVEDLRLDSKVREYKQAVLSRLSEVLKQGSLLEKSIALQLTLNEGDKKFAAKLYNSLKEQLVFNEQGAHFGSLAFDKQYKTNQMLTHISAMHGLYSYAADEQLLNQMKYWLAIRLRNQHFNNGFVLNHALHALTQIGDKLDDTHFELEVQLGNQKINVDQEHPYVYRTLAVDGWINQLELNKESTQPVWGAIYASYKEKLAEVKSQGKEVKVATDYYVEKIQGTKRILQPLQKNDTLHIGEVVVSRIHFSLEEDLDFVLINDSRSASLEPVDRSSGVRWGMLWYESLNLPSYVAIRDASTQYFYNSLQKGTYVLENRSYVSQAGVYESGIVSIQSLYAPELNGHSFSQQIVVE